MTIPIKGYLKKYLYWKENLPLDSKITLSANSKLGLVLGGLLVEKMRVEKTPLNPEDLIVYDSTFTFEMNTDYFKSRRWCMTNESIKFFNQYLYKDFHETLLLNVILSYRNHRIRETDSIRCFLDTLDISEDDISFDAIEKASYRERKARKFEKFRAVTVE
jgi:hypothetical protein